MINNFLIFEKYAQALKEGEYLNIYLIQRSKDGHSFTRCVKVYFITSLEDYRRKMNEMIAICDALHARAYLEIAPKSYDKFAKALNLNLAMRMASNDTMYLHRLVEKTTSSVTPNFKYFIFDIDNEDENDEARYNEILQYVKAHSPQLYEEKVMTKNGCHIISATFNVMEFRSLYPNVAIQKNWVTLLYMK